MMVSFILVLCLFYISLSPRPAVRMRTNDIIQHYCWASQTMASTITYNSASAFEESPKETTTLFLPVLLGCLFHP